MSGPPIPKSWTSARCFNAAARRAAYMSPEASPAEMSKGMGGIRNVHSIARRSRRREHARTRSRRDPVDAAQFLFLVLELIQAIVDATLRQQFLVRPLFAQTALVKHQYAVGVLNRAQAMRDHQRRTAAEQLVKRLANQQLCFRIHARGCFIQNQE